MPFTFCHPAIVLPLPLLSQRWFSLTGLVIGSLTPDFEYFLWMRMKGEFAHTVTGIFTFDLFIGIVLAFLFHNIVRDTLFNNLPTFLKSRVSIFRGFKWNKYFRSRWLVVIVSIIIGASSHVLWDGFTHRGGFFVERIGFLSSNIDIFDTTISHYRILQHASTLIGAVIICYAILRLPSDKHVDRHIDMRYWSVFILIVIVVVSIKFFAGLDTAEYVNVVVTFISAGLISLIATPVIMQTRE